MNSDNQLNQLFQAARRDVPAAVDREALGFETRLLASLREERARRAEPAFLVWKLTPFFAAALVVLSLVTALTGNRSGGLLELALEPDALVLYLTAQ